MYRHVMIQSLILVVLYIEHLKMIWDDFMMMQHCDGISAFGLNLFNGWN